ncbi:helix-turn-helix domain-containing protein [Acidovorax sp.]|uniref:helix-turn-helix domain-containing protein n=1 Tax=Acidovorax sp. TaxID=1872122 RepID=UPI003BB0EF43
MFGKRLAEERRRLGRSQDDFAQVIAIGRSGYAALEGDRAPLDVSRLVTLGEVVGVDVMFVMTGERAAVAATRLIDWSLVEGILAGMHSWAVAHDITVPPTKQMLLLKLLYQKLAAKGCMDTQALDDALRLVA